MASEELVAAIAAHYESLGRVEVPVPEWKTTFWAKPLTLDDQAKIDLWRSQTNDRYLVFARIIAMKAEDEAGNRLFTDQDFAIIKGGLGEVVSRIGRELTVTPEGEVEPPHGLKVEEAKKK